MRDRDGLQPIHFQALFVLLFWRCEILGGELKQVTLPFRNSLRGDIKLLFLMCQHQIAVAVAN